MPPERGKGDAVYGKMGRNPKNLHGVLLSGIGKGAEGSNVLPIPNRILDE